MVKYVVGLCVGIVLSIVVLIYPGNQFILSLLGGIIVGYCTVNIVMGRKTK